MLSYCCVAAETVLRQCWDSAETVLRQCWDGVLRQKCNDLLKSKIELVSNISGSENVLAMLCIGRKWTAKMILRPVRRQCSQQLNRELTLLQRMYCTALTGTKAAPIEIISRTTKEPSVVCCSCIRAYSYFWHTLKATMMSQFEDVFFYEKAHPFWNIHP